MCQQAEPQAALLLSGTRHERPSGQFSAVSQLKAREGRSSKPWCTQAPSTKGVRRLELLWAVLRLDRPLGLELKDVIRCMATCKTMSALALPQLTHLDFTREDVAGMRWWQPARLWNVTAASLHHTSVPAAVQLRRLRQLTIQASDVVELQPLSSLQRLTELQVLSYAAAELEHLPLLHSLTVNPYQPEELRALHRQRQLTALTLHADGYCCHCCDEELCAPDFQAVCGLKSLHSLTLLSMHLSHMQGAQTLAACSALRRLQVEFGGCDSWLPYEDLHVYGLSALTQLVEVCLSNAAHELLLQVLDTCSMPGLQTLVLKRPDPFFTGVAALLQLSVPLIEVQLEQQPWSSTECVLASLAGAHLAGFATVRLSGWPSDTAPTALLAYIRASILRLRQQGCTSTQGSLRCR